MAVIDWFSRYVLSWELSTTLDTSFCLEALERALQRARPEIFNTDQGVQFTCHAFVNRLKADEIRISWDGRGRALDTIFVERLWRSVKYEEVYIKDYQSVPQATRELRAYFDFYNHQRFHQSLDYQTPAAVYGNENENETKVSSGGSLMGSAVDDGTARHVGVGGDALFGDHTVPGGLQAKTLAVVESKQRVIFLIVVIQTTWPMSSACEQV